MGVEVGTVWWIEERLREPGSGFPQFWLQRGFERERYGYGKGEGRACPAPTGGDLKIKLRGRHTCRPYRVKGGFAVKARQHGGVKTPPYRAKDEPQRLLHKEDSKSGGFQCESRRFLGTNFYQKVTYHQILPQSRLQSTLRFGGWC